jgi:hypothetical protein
MTKLRMGLLITAGVLVLLIGAAGTAFYVKFYKPIASPLIAMSGAKALEEGRLKNRAEFVPPASGEVTTEQAGRFVAVEEAVQARLAAGAAVLAQKQADLEQAREAGSLSIPTTLLVFGEIKRIYLDAKVAQIDAMNRANFSKAEFEWVRTRLYRAAGLRLTQVDVSEILAGDPDPTVNVRRFEPGDPVGGESERLARPRASKLEAWRALGFFGL